MSTKRFFKLISGEVIYGECEIVKTENGGEILIKTPFTVVDGVALPYMSNVVGSSPAAIQIHPMNVLWQVPLDEFKQLEEQFIKDTTGLQL